jgi:hypothetical protein
MCSIGSIGSMVGSSVIVPIQPTDADMFSDDEEQYEIEGASDEESDSNTPSTSLDHAFQKAYDEFRNKLKWRLPSNDTVEDIFYKAYTKKNPELPASVRNLIRNWIVDLGNESIRALFSDADWESIIAEVPTLPVVDQEFAQSLVRFAEVFPSVAIFRRHD